MQISTFSLKSFNISFNSIPLGLPDIFALGATIGKPDFFNNCNIISLSGILIPIVVNVFGGDMNNELMIIAISACMAGAVCGDHCSPISDTTIMASAGAQCNHISHVSTQLPYALTAAAVSMVAYIFAGFIRNWIICLPIGIALMVVTLLAIKKADV